MATKDSKATLARADRASQDGKPYLVDAQVRRTGSAWSDDPLIPDIKTM